MNKVGKSNSIGGSLKFANTNSQTELIGNINNESGIVDTAILFELQKLMIKYKVHKIDVGWKGKF